MGHAEQGAALKRGNTRLAKGRGPVERRHEVISAFPTSFVRGAAVCSQAADRELCFDTAPFRFGLLINAHAFNGLRVLAMVISQRSGLSCSLEANSPRNREPKTHAWSLACRSIRLATTRQQLLLFPNAHQEM